MTDAARDSQSAASEAYTAGSYYDVFDTSPFVESVVSRMRAAKLQAWVGADESVFEFGLGTALNLRRLRCASKAAYDVSPFVAELCERHGIEHVASLDDLGDRSFDVILCHHVLEHVPSPFDVLAELRALLAPGGRLVLVVPWEAGRRFQSFRPGDPDLHLFAWHPLALGNLVARVGMKVEEVRVRQYGYQQRLAPLARLGMPTYRFALFLAGLLRPAKEIQLIATPC